MWHLGPERGPQGLVGVTDGRDSSAWDQEGASPCWKEKLGISLFPEERRLSSQGIVCSECTCCLGDQLSSQYGGDAVRTGCGWESRKELGCSNGGLFLATGEP